MKKTAATGRSSIAMVDVTGKQQAEEAVLASAQRYRALLEATTDGVWVHDPVSDTSASEHGARWWEETTGQPCAEAAGWGWLNVVHCDDRERIRCLWTHCRKTGAPYDAEYRVQSRDGGYRHLHVRGVPVRDSKGAIREWVGMLTDVTERFRAEQAVRKSEARLRRIFESRMIGLIIWDGAGGISDANDAFLDIVGYSRDDLREGRVRWRDLTPPEYARLDDGALAEIQRMGVCRVFEKEYVRKDGDRIPVLLGGAALEEEPDRCVAFVLDQSPRKRAEEALRRSEERFRAFMDHSPAAAWITDTEGRVLYLSATYRRMFRLPSVEPVGLTLFDLFPERIAQVYLDSVRKAAHQGRAVETIEPGVRPDGSQGTFLVYRFPLHDGSGNDLVGGVAADLSEFKLLEEQLRQVQKMKAIGQLAGGVAHDFNNLLTIIVGRCEIMLRRLAPEDPARRQVEMIQQAAARAEGLTRQLLAFSRKQVLQPTVLDLNAVVGRTEGMLRGLIGEDIELLWAPGAELWRVRADAGQVEQVLMNLSVNARDAMLEGGKLRIETRNVELDQAFASNNPGLLSGAYVMLSIGDTGVGMSAETRSHCFEPFFTTKEARQGTGLGLSTVYGIVKQHQGYIRVDSAIGCGTTFRIYLPRVRELPEPILDRPPEAEIRGGRETILLVEDEDGVRAVAEEILQGLGYVVLAAGHPTEALATSDQFSGGIELLLTDVVLPGLTGCQLAEHLRTARPGIKVLYVSGYTGNAGVLRRIEAGEKLLPKPFTPEDLARKVREVLDAPGT